jgi:hypothetical protein
MAVPQPPRPGQAVRVKFNEPFGVCGGCVTRVLGHDVYVCYEGEAHEYEEPLDWSDAAVRRIVTVQKPAAAAAPTARRQDRRSRAEKATGWGGPSRRRRRRAAPPAPEEGRQPEDCDDNDSDDGGHSSPAFAPGSVPFVRTPSGRLVAGSPDGDETISLHRTASHQLLEHSREALASQQEQLEAEARRLEEELERELHGSMSALSLGNAEASSHKKTVSTSAAACSAESPGSEEGDADKRSQQPCVALIVNPATPTPEGSEGVDEEESDSVDWKAECWRLRQRESQHLRQIADQDRQLKMLQAMLKAAAGLSHSDTGSDVRYHTGMLELRG